MFATHNQDDIHFSRVRFWWQRHSAAVSSELIDRAVTYGLVKRGSGSTTVCRFGFYGMTTGIMVERSTTVGVWLRR